MMGDFKALKAEIETSWQASSNGKIYWCAEMTGHELTVVENKLFVDGARTQLTALPPSPPVVVVPESGENSTLPYRGVRLISTCVPSRRDMPAGLVNTVAASWARAA
jgi:hypothetical protein